MRGVKKEQQDGGDYIDARGREEERELTLVTDLILSAGREWLASITVINGV